MEDSQSQSEPGEEMSSEQNNSQDFDTDGNFGFRHRPFGQVRGGSVFRHHRLVILSLALLNAVLLIAAVVMGIYCAKGDLQLPRSAATPILIEMNYFRNISEIIRAKLEFQAKLARERANHLQLKLQVKQTATLPDSLQRAIENLHTERDILKSNKTTIERSCGRCQEGWSLLKSSCYYFSKYVSDSKKNWSDSRANCISQGSDLLVIDNLEEQQLINDNASIRKSISPSSEIGFWIGLTDKVRERTWVWVNNRTEVEGYWRDGQPVYDEQRGRNCAVFYFLSHQGETWYNEHCDERHFWICEMEPSLA